ncbi:MAG: NAD(P)/FAD-dependent oxidoreductase [bacterium]|nr:NAD(P)/FAD-dependent oxidoreductase [bacterium]
MKKIIVAGAGHGGLVVAIKLSKVGYDVTVIEQKKEELLGYNWYDSIDINVFKKIGLPLPSTVHCSIQKDLTIYNPALSSPKSIPPKPSKPKFIINRKDLIRFLIEEARNQKVKFLFNTKVIKPLIDDNKIIGIKTSNGKLYASLIVDALGISSTLRTKLPRKFEIVDELSKYQTLYAYRGIYNQSYIPREEAKYKTYITSGHNASISWAIIDKDEIDVLVGAFTHLTKNKINKKLKEIRKLNPYIGKRLIKEGNVYRIPVRSPFSLIVHNNYALVGDSASMTVPIKGSGITLSLIAGNMLAKTIIENKDKDYSISNLWPYQYEFISKQAFSLISVDLFKILMLRLTNKELDFLFESGIITEQNIIDIQNSKNIEIQEILSKCHQIITNKSLLKITTNIFLSIIKAKALCAQIPSTYNKKKVNKWIKNYDSFIKKQYKKIK